MTSSKEVTEVPDGVAAEPEVDWDGERVWTGPGPEIGEAGLTKVTGVGGVGIEVQGVTAQKCDVPL